MKVVINRCFGGFGLSAEAKAELRRRWPECPDYFGLDEDARSNPDLVAVVEELGEEANGRFSSLAVVEVPDDAKWHIEEYDGFEHVAENHRTWR